MVKAQQSNKLKIIIPQNRVSNAPLFLLQIHPSRIGLVRRLPDWL